jgi:hypothetical protein
MYDDFDFAFYHILEEKTELTKRNIEMACTGKISEEGPMRDYSKKRM